MRLKITIIGAIVILLISLGSAQDAPSSFDNKDSFRIHVDEQVGAEDYIFRVENPSAQELGLQLEVAREDKYSENLLLQETIEGFSSDERKIYAVNDADMLVEVNRIGWADEGRYMNITVYSDENIFAISELDVSIPENVVVSREEDISVPLTLKNKGTVNQSISLSYNASEGISVKFSYGGFNVTSIEVASGETETVSSTLEILESARIGDHNVTFRAEGSSNSSETVSFNVIGSEKEKSMTMELDRNFIQTRPGERIRINPTLRNTGEVMLEEVEFDVETPDGWTMDNNRMRSSSVLRPHGREREYLRIRVPSNAEAGDYYVDVTPTTEELEGETQQIRVNIRKRSGMSYVGAGLMLVSLLGMIVTYRKLGRR